MIELHTSIRAHHQFISQDTFELPYTKLPVMMMKKIPPFPECCAHHECNCVLCPQQQKVAVTYKQWSGCGGQGSARWGKGRILSWWIPPNLSIICSGRVGSHPFRAIGVVIVSKAGNGDDHHLVPGVDAVNVDEAADECQWCYLHGQCSPVMLHAGDVGIKGGGGCQHRCWGLLQSSVS